MYRRVERSGKIMTEIMSVEDYKEIFGDPQEIIKKMTPEEVISLRGWGAMKIRGYTYREYRNIRRRANRKYPTHYLPY